MTRPIWARTFSTHDLGADVLDFENLRAQMVDHGSLRSP